MRKKLGYFFLASNLIMNSQAQPEAPKAEIPKTTKEITVKILNKITGKATTLKTVLLKPIRYGHLIIRPRACFKKKIGRDYTVNWSFIEAWVQKPKYQPIHISTIPHLPQQPLVSLVFSSWINSASPNFSHPDYGITIQDCQEVAVTSLEPHLSNTPTTSK